MPNKTIPDLPAIPGALAVTDEIEVAYGVTRDGSGEIVDPGQSVRIPLSVLKTLVNTDPTVVPSAVPWRGARVRLTANLAYTANTVISVPWQAATIDTDGIWSAGAPTRLTVPSGVTKVRLSGNLRWSGGSGTHHIASIKGNGGGSAAPFEGMFRVRGPGIGGALNDQNGISGTIAVAPGDYFELQAICSASMNILSNEATWFQMEVVEA